MEGGLACDYCGVLIDLHECFRVPTEDSPSYFRVPEREKRYPIQLRLCHACGRQYQEGRLTKLEIFRKRYRMPRSYDFLIGP